MEDRHSLIKSKMEEMQAPLAGELSGHIFFKERWYGFDDAIYAGARLLEILVRSGRSSEALFADMPEGVSTPELRVELPEASHQTCMQRLRDSADFPGAEIIDTDGVRVEFPDGWGLVRASNTSRCSPCALKPTTGRPWKQYSNASAGGCRRRQMLPCRYLF